MGCTCLERAGLSGWQTESLPDASAMVWEAWRRAAAAEATEQWRGVTTTELGQLCGIHANSVTKTGISQLTYTTGTCELTYLRTVEYLQHVHHANATWIRVTTRSQRRHNTKDAGNYWGRGNLDCTPINPITQKHCSEMQNKPFCSTSHKCFQLLYRVSHVPVYQRNMNDWQ